jgi:hypothetical protein
MLPEPERSLNQAFNALAPSDFFPCRSLFDQAADFWPNIELQP